MAKRQRILLIDDSEDFRTTVATRLNAEGFETTALATGSEGLALTAHQTFDLILIDMLMPGKDGVTTYQELRENPKTREVPIILLTGVAVEGHWEPLGYESDTRAFVMGKPYDHSTLLARITQVLSEASGGL